MQSVASAPILPFQRLDFRGCRPQNCLPSSFEATLGGIRTQVEKIRNGQFTISAQLRGYQTQIGYFKQNYDQWQTELNKTFMPRIRELRTQLKQEASKISLLAADGETVAKLMVQYRSLYQELRFLKYQAKDLLTLVIGEAHRSSLELYKTTMKECDALWHSKAMSPLEKFKKLHDIAKIAVEKINTQQDAIKDVKGSLLGNEVSKLHRRTLEYFSYQVKNYRKPLPEGDTEERRELLRIDNLVEIKKVDVSTLIAMQELTLSETTQILVEAFLDSTQEVTLPKVQEMRQSSWDVWGIGTKMKNWWYSGIGDGQVTSQLRQLGLSINKVLSTLQDRILDLACGNLSPDQGFKDLKEEEDFYRKCRHELSKRLREQQAKLYDADFDERMHAGIYTIDQRSAGCADIKLHSTMFHLLGTNPDIANYLRTHGKLLQFLKSDDKKNPGYITSYEAIKGLFDATMSLATMPELRFNKKDHFHRYGRKTYSLVHDTIQNTAQRTLALVGLEEKIQDQVLSGERLEDLVKQETLTDLPEVVKSCIAKEAYRLLFYTTDTTNPKLDLFLHALQKSYKPLFDKAMREDAQFKTIIDAYSSLSDWKSSEKSQKVLDLLVTICRELGEISRNPSMDGEIPHAYNAELNFVRYSKARQKFTELQSLDNSLAQNSPACMDRIRMFRPLLEKQLSAVEDKEEYPGFFAHLGQIILMPVKTKEPREHQHLTILGPDQRVQVLYKHLVTYLFGDSDKKQEIANTLHVLLTHHCPDSILTLCQDVNAPKKKYVLVLLYRFLLESLAKADLDYPHYSLSSRQYNLLRNFLETCYRKDAAAEPRLLWNAQYSPGFMHNALRLLVKFNDKIMSQEADPQFLKQWNDFYLLLKKDEHFAIWAAVMDAYYRFVKTLGTNDVVTKRSQDYAILEQQIKTATEALNSRPVPEDPTYGNILAAAKWCKDWMVNELVRVTPK